MLSLDHDPVGHYVMALPAVIEPCLPSPGEQPPTGPGWVHEIKHDGYRLMARRDALSVGIKLLTRNCHQGGVHSFRIVARRWKSGRPSSGRPVFYYSPVSVGGNNQSCEERSNSRRSSQVRGLLSGVRQIILGCPKSWGRFG
jgi:hypothetical protein